MSKEERIMLDLETFADGEVAEDFQEALEKIADNIQDLNTEATVERKVTLELKFKPTDDSRQVIPTSGQIKTKLAPRKKAESLMLSGRDVDTGFVEMKELQSGVPGQTQIDEDGKLKTDTGEEIDTNGNVIDWNKRNTN